MSVDEKFGTDVIMMDVEEIFPYKNNTKLHSVPQIRRIANSISSYGWDQHIVVDKDRVIIKGHGRYLAAKYLSLEKVPVFINKIISEEDVRLARIADNKAAESGWDLDVLWGEIKELGEEGLTAQDLAFTDTNLKKLFPDTYEVEEKEKKKEKKGAASGRVDDVGKDVDATEVEEEGFIGVHRGEDAWLKKLSIVDYLNHHDKILVFFSSGKDSIATLIWALENCDRSKILVLFANPGWGVDWPHSLVLLPIIEKQYGVKIFIAGDSDPACPGGFEDNLLQAGYPSMGHSCWVEGWVKIPRVDALMSQEGLLAKESGLKIVQVLGIRWEESPHRAKIYPDRGYFKDNGNNFSSPLIKWTNADIATYLNDRGVKLHTAYQNSDKMGCVICPKTVPRYCVSLRKKYPKYWKKVIEYYALGSRVKNELPYHFSKWLLSIEDDMIDESRFSGLFSHLALSDKELEDLYEEAIEEKINRPHLAENFDIRNHKFKNDLRTAIVRHPKGITQSCVS